MKFGMNLLLWTGDLHDEHAAGARIAQEDGLRRRRGADLRPEPDKFAQWGKRLDDLGLERTAVTIRTDADNPISPDAKVRAAGVDANQADARLLPGRRRRNARRPVPLGPRRVQRRRARRPTNGSGASTACGKWPSTPSKAGVMLGVEYLNRFEMLPAELRRRRRAVRRDVNHPNCRMMYDTFHANIEEKNIAEAIRDCADAHGPRAHFRERPQHARARATSPGTRRSTR